jgi:hypothetical protein
VQSKLEPLIDLYPINDLKNSWDKCKEGPKVSHFIENKILQALDSYGVYKSLILYNRIPLQCSNWCITVQTSNGVALAQMDQRTKSWNIRDIHKVRKRQHQYPKFGHTHVEINPQKSTLAFKGGVKLRKPWLSPWLSFFPERLHCWQVFYCSYLYSYYDSSLTL